MSLTSALLIGRSGLTAAQTGIQVAGDNLANAATPGYSRRTLSLAPVAGAFQGSGVYTGRGVSVQEIARSIDPAIQRRLRAAVSDQQGAQVRNDILSQVESVTGALSGSGLSSQLNEFFDAFSELANNPSSAESRALIVQRGQTIGSFVQGLRRDLTDLRAQVDSQIESSVERVNGLLTEIADLNDSITQSERGQGENAALRDQRDEAISKLSELMDVSVVERETGAADLFVGSTPVVLGGESRGLSVQRFDVPGADEPNLVLQTTGEDPQKVFPTSGRIGALLGQRNGRIAETLGDLDRVASSLIYEVNRLHSQGQPFPGLTDTTAALRLPDAASHTLALNDPANATLAGLPFEPTNGHIEFAVTDSATGLTQTRRMDIDLDGIDSGGAQGFGDDTSLQDVVDFVNASVPNLNAEITGGGALRVYADDGFEFGFREDTSGVLATLGVNTFFDGADASDVSVREELEGDPNLLVSGRSQGSNEAALAIAGLRERPVSALGEVSLLEGWRQATDAISVDAAGAQTDLGAAEQVKSSLEAQHLAVSGVSVDEETINLLTYQQQYSAAARVISTVDELTNLLISLV